MITLVIASSLALALLALCLARACHALAPLGQRPFRNTSALPAPTPPAARVSADIVSLRGQLRSRTLREPAVVWPATDFADTEVSMFDDLVQPTAARTAALTAAPQWTPLDRRDDLRLNLKF